MFRFLLITLTFFPILLRAAQEPWSIDEARRRFEVRGEVFVLGPSGKNIFYKSAVSNLWKTRDKSGKIENQWTSNSTYAPVAILHTWQLQDDGTIKADIEQYDNVHAKNATGKEKLGKLVKKISRVIENLEPVVLITANEKDHRVVVRFTPGFSDGGIPKAVSDMPIAGQDVIVSDNEGNVWANHLTYECKYCGILTARGSLFLSYYPFPGAKEIGIAAGPEIEIRLSDKQILSFRSKTDFLPQNVTGKVFGLFFPERKHGTFPSSGVMGRSLESEFVEAIKRWPN